MSSIQLGYVANFRIFQGGLFLQVESRSQLREFHSMMRWRLLLTKYCRVQHTLTRNMPICVRPLDVQIDIYLKSYKVDKL